MKTNAIVVSINYAGMQLLIVKNEAGEDCTPLKPIVDLFGIQWERQRKKINESAHLSKFLGVCTVHMYGAGAQKREETCILLSRVAAFIMSINPERVRSHGNIAAAGFLEQKLEEWADALHDYEELGIAVNLNHIRTQEATGRQCMRVAALLKIKTQLPTRNERRLMDAMIARAANGMGIAWQPDLLDNEEPSK